ncbi:MAG: hypothetical protein K0Q72_843 [Armatimonadetes bacterium]|jgi:hypothetical protein|nr:hypothetical protein [Armatimonadota bacterium]
MRVVVPARTGVYAALILLVGGFSLACHLAAFRLIDVNSRRGLSSTAGSPVFLPRPEAVNSLILFGLAGAPALVALFLGGQCQPRPRSRMRFVALLGAVVPLLPLPGYVLAGFGNAVLEDQVTGADGHAYYFLHESAIQGYTWALARRTAGNPFYLTAQVIGGHGENSSGVDLAVVRPEPLKPGGTYYRMYRGGDWVAGVTERHCVLAYNTRTGRFYTRPDLQQLSPFFLLGPATMPHQPDLRTLTEAATSEPASFPIQQVIVGDLAHPKAEVRLAAAQLLSTLRSVRSKPAPRASP